MNFLLSQTQIPWFLTSPLTLILSLLLFIFLTVVVTVLFLGTFRKENKNKALIIMTNVITSMGIFLILLVVATFIFNKIVSSKNVTENVNRLENTYEISVASNAVDFTSLEKEAVSNTFTFVNKEGFSKLGLLKLDASVATLFVFEEDIFIKYN